MNMKNATILLLFLICLLGLIIGVYYTETGESSESVGEYDSIVHVDKNGTITIHVEKKDNTENFLNRYFT